MKLLFITSFLSLCISIYGQSYCELSGRITDSNKQPLTGSVVSLNSLQKAVITDSKGFFSITKIPEGIYRIEISFIGYNTVVDTLQIKENTTYNVSMQTASVGLQKVVVEYDIASLRKKEESLNIEIIDNDFLKKNLGGSIMSSLERLPGVSTIDIGSGQSKPVIRGLGFNRVAVVENGVKHEAQQWGSDHGLEIDQYEVDNTEIVKGPASLMYGSEAIGGVIAMKSKNIPGENTFGGTVDMTGKSNNDFLGSSVSLFFRKKVFFCNARITISNYGDYKVPTDSVDIYSYRAALYKNNLRNTAGKERDVHVSFGFVKNRFQSRFFVSNIYSKSGFFANAHGLEPRNIDTETYDKSNRDILNPYQTVNHFKIVNENSYRWNKSSVNINLGYQQNFRQEFSNYTGHGYMPAVFPDTLEFDSNLERGLNKHTLSLNGTYSYWFNEKTLIKCGTDNEYQHNEIDGSGFIIPAYNQLEMGVFAFAKHDFSKKHSLQVGARYDYGIINTEQYKDWFPSPVINSKGDTTMEYLVRADEISRSFSNFIWSVGYNFNTGKWLTKVNLGKSFRMPIAKEIAANGVNYHNYSYEVGNSNLSAEISYQLDLGIDYSRNKFSIGFSPFVNYFPNYIYLNPSYEYDRLYGNGNQIYYYTQSEVFRSGVEIHTEYKILESLVFGFEGDYLYAIQLSGEKKGFSLPFSSPASALFNIKYTYNKLSFAKNIYLSVDYKLVAAQNHIVPPETTTNGYSIMNVGAGCNIKAGKQKIIFSMQVRNIFNTKYFNHTSYYRLIGIPEAGRNFIMNISFPFEGSLKNN